MIRRIVAVLVATLAVAACSSTSGPLDPDQAPRSRYSGQAGESPVGVIPEGTVRDTERAKDLVFTVEYPTRPGSYPVIFFSHGFGATRQMYVGLSSHWASQGYVVIKPAHADAGRLQTSGVNTAWENQTPTDWRNRVRDITALIDALDRIEESYPELKGKIDRDKIGVGGHSYGAFTAMLLAGARTFAAGSTTGASYADPRVKAAVVMSPQGPSETFGLTPESWKGIRVPVLYMTGTLDKGLSDNETPEWRRQAFDLSPDGDKWLAVLAGASHGSFAGQMDPLMQGRQRPEEPMLGDPRRRDPMDRRQATGEGSAGMRIRNTFVQVKALSLAFFDAYLRSDAEGRTTLEGAGTRGGVELSRK
jgi:predicted dienelactone hydrolase